MPRIAIAQTRGTPLSAWRETLSDTVRLIREAARRGADLLLLPECVFPTYGLRGADEYKAARNQGMPDHSAAFAAWCDAARANDILVCAGCVEESRDALFNSACLIDRDGQVRGVYRKSFLWGADHDCFRAGDRIEPIDCSLGRIGVMICADARLPEIAATLVNRGAQLLLQPTAWINLGTRASPWNPQPEFIIPARSSELGVPIASADKAGQEGDYDFAGNSILCTPAGVCSRCGPFDAEVVMADIAMASSARIALTQSDRMVLERVRPPAPARDGSLQAQTIQLGSPADSRGCEAVGGWPALEVSSVELSPAAENPIATRAIRKAIAGPCDEPFRVGDATVAALHSREAATYGPIRARALLGLDLAVVFGDTVTVEQLQTRAAENRIFVAWVRSEGVTVFGVDGRPLARADAGDQDRSARWNLPIAAAREKQVAPGSDVLRGRRPEQYQL